jgi:hypothetical protein
MFLEYKMPGADASQFTQLKKAYTVSNVSVASNSYGKSVNRLTQRVLPLSAAVSISNSGPPNGLFLPSLTLKNITPQLRFRPNQGLPSSGTPPCH